MQVLSNIAAVTMAVDHNNIEETWKALSNSNTLFTVSKNTFCS